MADKETNGRVVETIEEATQAERSPDTFYILIISLVALAVVGAFFAVVLRRVPRLWFTTGALETGGRHRSRAEL